MGLFTQSSGGTGEKYEYLLPGSYIGELVEFTEGRLKPDFNDPENVPPTQMVNWHWNLYQPDGVTPVMHEGNQVVYVDETSHKTGKLSKSAAWFTAHLKRKFDSRTELVDRVMEECIGKKVMLIITEKDNGYKKTDVFPSGV